MELLARSLSDASETIKVVATVGVILIVQAIALLWHEANPPTFPQFLSQSTVEMLGVNVTWAQIILFGFSLVAGAVLYLFFKYVRLGVVMRGVVDDPSLVSMSGDDPVRARRWAWIIGTVFAAVAGLLLAYLARGRSFSPDRGVLCVRRCCDRQLQQLALDLRRWTRHRRRRGSVRQVRRDDLVARRRTGEPAVHRAVPGADLHATGAIGSETPSPGQAGSAPVLCADAVRLSFGVLVIALLALVPSLQASHLAVWSIALIDIILFLSLGLLVRKSGQISLCHLAFAAVGAAAFGHFAVYHIPWLLALVLATLVAAPVGALVAIPAVRVSGVFLAARRRSASASSWSRSFTTPRSCSVTIRSA